MAPAMGERFELRLGEDILSRVDAWRGKQEDVPSRAEAMRRLVELGLARARQEVVSFSDGEKVLMMMIRDLYKRFAVDGDVNAEFIAEVIWGGHYWAPKWDLPGLFHDHEDDPKDVHFVLDVLDVWDCLERAYKKFSKKDKDRIVKEVPRVGSDVRFRGFDGNTEAVYGNIAHFLVEKMERFPDFKRRDFNSHMPMEAAYRRMVAVFEPMRTSLVGRELDVVQVIRILKAMYPTTEVD